MLACAIILKTRPIHPSIKLAALQRTFIMSHTDSNMLLSLLLLLIVASFTAYYANRKGRNPLLWFILGVLLGIFAPLILMFFSSIKNGRSDNGLPTMTVSKPDPSLQHLPLAPTSEELKQQEENKLWYYLDQNHQQMGPVSIIALRELWNRGQLELNSYVWTDGMEKWEKVDNLSDLKAALNKL
jgi:hypothetical protein